jgi:hypothetical protein
MTTWSSRLLPLIRGRAARGALDVVVNVGLPYVAYRLAQPKLGDVHALLVSMIPPLVWSLAEFARNRRIDALSIVILAGIALSLLAFLGGGSVRFLQLRENFVTGAFGLAFLVSAAIGRPLIYQLARAGMQRSSAAEAESFAQLQSIASVRRTMTLMTVVWGTGLVAQTALACVLVFRLPIATYLLVSPILGYGIIGALALWTFWYARRQKRIGAERRRRADEDALQSQRKPA